LLVAIVILVFCGAMCSFFGRNVGQLASTALLVAIVLLLHLWSDGPVLWPECLPTCIISLARCDCYFVSLVVRWVRFVAEMFASTALIVAIVLLLFLWCGGPVFWQKCWPTCINSIDRCDCYVSYLVVRWASFLAVILANLHQQPCSLRLFLFFSCGAMGPFFG
jgi:hypothetical protein